MVARMSCLQKCSSQEAKSIGLGVRARAATGRSVGLVS